MMDISSFDRINLRRRSSGFTLLEVMVALAVIAIVLVSVLRMQGQTISMNEAFRFYSIAPQLATAKMAEIRIDPEAVDLSRNGDFGEDYQGYKWQAAVDTITLVTPEDREMKFKQVDVTVTYQEDGYAYTVREYLPDDSDRL